MRPLLVKHCYACHGPDKQKGGLRLDQKADALKGGDDGAVIVAGKGADSPLVRLTAGVEADRACPRRATRLTAEQVGVLRAWIDQGAKWPATAEAADPLRLVVVPPAEPPGPAETRGRRRGPRSQRGRSVHPGEAPREGPEPVAGGRPPHAHPPAVLRPDRPAADAGRGRRVRRATRHRTPTSSWSIGCWRRRPTASAGPGTGSTWSTTATRTATTRTSRGPTPGRTATTSSARSTPTSRMRGSSRSRSPATCSSPARRDGIAALGLHRGRAVGLRSATPRCRRPRSTARSPATSTATTWWPTRSTRSSSLTVQCAQCHDHKFDPIDAGGLLPPAGGVRRPRPGRPAVSTPTRRRARRCGELTASGPACERRQDELDAKVKAAGRAGTGRASIRRSPRPAGAGGGEQPEFGYHSQIGREAGRGQVGAGRSRAVGRRSTASSCGAATTTSTTSAPASASRSVQDRGLRRPGVQDRRDGHRRPTRRPTCRTRRRSRRRFTAGGGKGALRPRHGDEAGAAAERLHLRPGRAGGARRRRQEPGAPGRR